MDRQSLYALPRLSAAGRNHRRIQRQVHGQSDGAARRRGGDAAGPCSFYLSQFLLSRLALGVRRHTTGGGSMSARPVRARFHDFAPEPESFRDCVITGLSERQKEIPCRFLYDERGSELFEAICDTPEYYPTRTETAILADCASEIASLMGPHCQLVEFGSGSSRKVRLLLSAFDQPSSYVAIEISREALQQAADDVATQFPRIDVRAVCADYMAPLDLAEIPEPKNGRRLGFFPGSTIGNLDRAGAVHFLRRCRQVVGRHGAMLVGVDLKKDARLLHAAYNDAA